MKQACIFIGLLGALLLGGCNAGGAGDSGQEFDFYVLALSWSPSYCDVEGKDSNPQQCGSKESPGFVVHGLWPQYEQGYPEYCNMKDDGHFSQRELHQWRKLFPSDELARHQWRKHGSCTGLERGDYFSDVREARDRISIPGQFSTVKANRRMAPNQIEAAFRQANAGLVSDAIAVSCKGGLLWDVRICMNRDFQFRSCPEVDQKGCRARTVRIPAVRPDRDIPVEPPSPTGEVN